MKANDIVLLARATIQIYRTAAFAAGRAVFLNWWLPAVQLGVLIIVSPVVFLAGGLGIIGGFILGFLFAFLVAGFYAGVVAGVDKERLVFGELRQRATELFQPFIAVLFGLFLINLVVSAVLGHQGSNLGELAISLVIALVLNPLPEVAATHRSFATASFTQCFEFVRENIIEWFLPYFLFLGALWFVSHELAIVLLGKMLLVNPLAAIESFLIGLTQVATQPFVLGLCVLVMYIVYIVCCFRLSLYQQLASSTRRKRIYQMRFGS